jgi:CBS domain-containing protein
VIRKGGVELRVDDVVLDLLGEGECFGQFSLLAHEGPIATVIAHKDTLCYLVPEPIASEVFESEAGRSYLYGLMRSVFHASGDRLLADRPDARFHSLESLLRRPPVTVAPETSAADAAARMADERASSLLVQMRGGWGIVTDRDLRSMVAARKSHNLPVEQIATFPAKILPSSTTASDALVEMFAQGVHHFPVADARGEILGVVTDTDLMGMGRHTPFALRNSIQRAKDSDQAIATARELPQVVVALLATGADPVDIGRIVALVIELLLRSYFSSGSTNLAIPQLHGLGSHSEAPPGRSNRSGPIRTTRSPGPEMRPEMRQIAISLRWLSAWPRDSRRSVYPGAGATRWQPTPNSDDRYRNSRRGSAHGSRSRRSSILCCRPQASISAGSPGRSMPSPS